MAFALVRLEYEHVANCSEEEEEEEDGRYWDVDSDRRHPSNGGVFGWIWRREMHLTCACQCATVEVDEGKNTVCEDAIALTTFTLVQGSPSERIKGPTLTAGALWRFALRGRFGNVACLE